MSVEDGNIIIKPARRKRYSLEELVGAITPENRHDEVVCGEPVGNEFW
jgi:antitoxin MazE